MAATSPKTVGKPMDIETGSIRSVSRSSVLSGSQNVDKQLSSKWEGSLLRVRSGSTASQSLSMSGYATGSPKSPDTDKRSVSALADSLPVSPSREPMVTAPLHGNKQQNKAFSVTAKSRSTNKASTHTPSEAEVKRANFLDNMTGIKDPTYDGSYTTPSRGKEQAYLAVTNPIVAYKQQQTYHNQKDGNTGGGFFHRSTKLDPDTENWAGLVKDGATVEETLKLAEQQAAWNLAEKKRMDAEAEARREKEAAEAREQAEVDRLDAEHRARIREQEKAIEKEEKAARRAAHAEMRQAARALEQARKNERAEERRQLKEQRAAEKQARAEARAAEKRAAAEATLNGEPLPEGAETIATDAELSDDDEEEDPVSDDNEYHSAVDEEDDSEAGSSVTETGTVEPAPKKRMSLMRRISSSMGKNYQETNATATTEAPVKRRRSLFGKDKKTASSKPQAVIPIPTDSSDESSEEEEDEEPLRNGEEAVEVAEVEPVDAENADAAVVQPHEQAGQPVKRSKSWLRIFGKRDRSSKRTSDAALPVIPIPTDSDAGDAADEAERETFEPEENSSTIETPDAAVVESSKTTPIAQSVAGEQSETGDNADARTFTTQNNETSPQLTRRKSWLARKFGKSQENVNEQTTEIIGVGEVAAPTLGRRKSWLGKNYEKSSPQVEGAEIQPEEAVTGGATPALSRRKSWLGKNYEKSSPQVEGAESQPEETATGEVTPTLSRRKSWLGKNYERSAPTSENTTGASAASALSRRLSQHYSEAEVLPAYGGAVAPEAAAPSESPKRRRSFLGRRSSSGYINKTIPGEQAVIPIPSDTEDEAVPTRQYANNDAEANAETPELSENAQTETAAPPSDLDHATKQPDAINVESVAVADAKQKSPLSRRISWGPVRRKKSKKVAPVPTEPSSILVNSRPTSIVDTSADVEDEEEEEGALKEGGETVPIASETADANDGELERKITPVKEEAVKTSQPQSPASPTTDGSQKKRGFLSKVFKRRSSKSHPSSTANGVAGVTSDDEVPEVEEAESATPVDSEKVNGSESAAETSAEPKGGESVTEAQIDSATPPKEDALVKSGEAEVNVPDGAVTSPISPPHTCETMHVKNITPARNGLPSRESTKELSKGDHHYDAVKTDGNNEQEVSN